MTINMVANHAIRPVENDPIFTISAKAAVATNTVGAKNIINGSMGVLLEDDGGLVAFKSVYNHLKELEAQDIAAYANIEGDPLFLDAVKEACFMEYKPEGYIEAVATPGGSGAIHHAIYNYTNPGETFITANWYWDPYKTMANENMRQLDNFNLFNDKNEFDMESFKEKFLYHLNRQGRLLTILNTPAHNPTGYTVTDDEWDEIIDIMKDAAKDSTKRIILLVDIAYIDFCNKEPNRRAFMKKFSGLPENILVMFAFSASKGYTMYGLRNGALLCVSSSEEIAQEFFYTNLHSNRGTWSNGTKAAMQVLTDIINNNDLNEEYTEERDHYREMLAERADAFVNACKEEGLNIAPYKDGYFASIPCADPIGACEKLMEENIFTCPLQGGLRFAICAVSEEKCKIAPRKIKNILNL